MPSIETLTAIYDAITFAGLIGLGYNAYLVHKQVKAANQQVKAANDQVEGMSRPALVFLPPNDPEISRRKPGAVAEYSYFHLLNIGSGPAFRVKVNLLSVPGVVEEFASLRPDSIQRVSFGLRENETTVVDATYFSLGDVCYRTVASRLDGKMEHEPKDAYDRHTAHYRRP